MLLNLAIVSVAAAIVVVLWSPRIHRWQTWRATITPLASIIGSGFLVLGPILEASYGAYAPLVMAALCGTAYLFGGAIRYNIRALAARGGGSGRFSPLIEIAASWSLAFAYVVSVAYYLNLFGAFGLSLSGIHDPSAAKLLTSAVFVTILCLGWLRGFEMLENLEYAAVAAKLAIIGGLFVGLGAYFTEKVGDGALIMNPPALSGWAALTLAFGLIVTVQGFETSRYLGDEYGSETRIRSMRWAQWLSSAIYMIYIVLIAYSFERGEMVLTETTIVEMMKVVAPILPTLLVAAALAAQFSAAVADTGGSGGLIAELTRNRISARMGYAILTGIGLVMTWSANVFEIISYASRAFAIYYGLQAALAAVRSWNETRSRWPTALFAALAGLGLVIALFGAPVEV